LFIDPSKPQIDAVLETGAPIIELHTGCYANAPVESNLQKQELTKLADAAAYAHAQGLQVNAGHGLHIHNVAAIAAIPTIVELNIGHSIVSQALFSGFARAVSDMKHLMVSTRHAV